MARTHRRPMRMRALRSLLACAAVALLATGAQALTFAQAYDAARGNDALYRGAGHELEAAQLNVPIARAALLPAVGLSASRSDVTGTRGFANSLNQDVRVRADYANPQANLSLRMPILNYEALSRYRQARVQSDQADSVFRIRGLDLIDRLAVSYLQVLLSEEGVRLGEAQVQALTVQSAQAQQRLERGEGTRVDAAQTVAALDVARVRLIEARDLLELARRQLQRITGLPTPPVHRVAHDYMPTPLQAQTLAEWLDLALRQSPTLQAREQALMAARFGVQRNLAGHLPRLDLVASLARSQNESLSSLNQTSTLGSIGLQLNVPLYSGGGVQAGVKQALAEQARAEEEIRVERENIAVEVQRHFALVDNGAARIAAHMQSVASAEFALRGARRALEAGQATNFDVADLQSRLHTAQRDLAQARVDYLLARVRLMLQAGQAMAEIAADLDRALVAAPAPLSASTK